MNFVEELTWRGMVHTMMPGTEELLAKEQVTASRLLGLPLCFLIVPSMALSSPSSSINFHWCP